MTAKSLTAEQYINQFDPRIRHLLKDIRTIVKRAIPAATEYVEQDMPAFAMRSRKRRQ